MKPWAAALLYAVLGAITSRCVPLLWAISTTSSQGRDLPRRRRGGRNISFDAYENCCSGTVAPRRARACRLPPTSHLVRQLDHRLGRIDDHLHHRRDARRLFADALRFWGQRWCPNRDPRLHGAELISVIPMFLTMGSLELTDTCSRSSTGYVGITLPFCLWLMWPSSARAVEIEGRRWWTAPPLQVFRQIVQQVAIRAYRGEHLLPHRLQERLPVRAGLHEFDGNLPLTVAA